MKTKMLTIEIWSDIQCPFCYVGKHKFDLALEAFQYKDQVEVIWRSFQLNPKLITNTEISNTLFLYRNKGLSKQMIDEMSEKLINIGHSLGLTFDFDKLVVANSHKSHQLLHYAKNYQLEDTVKESLFKAYFADGKNIDDICTLLEIAEQAGLNKHDTSIILNARTFYNKVQQDIMDAKKIGIQNVPYFIFNKKHTLIGAQETSTFIEMITMAYNKKKEENDKLLTDTELGAFFNLGKK